MTTLGRLALLLGLLGLPYGCTRTESHSHSFRYFEVDGKVEATATIDGVRIDFDPSVEVHFSMDVGVAQVSNDGVNDNAMTVNGLPFHVQSGEFLIGGTRYGKVEAGDRVHVSAEGVTVNGEPRGELP